jgi:hypothetical protein
MAGPLRKAEAETLRPEDWKWIAAAIAAARSAAPTVPYRMPAVRSSARQKLLFANLEHGRAIDAHSLRAAMIAAFSGSDADDQ